MLLSRRLTYGALGACIAGVLCSLLVYWFILKPKTHAGIISELTAHPVVVSDGDFVGAPSPASASAWLADYKSRGVDLYECYLSALSETAARVNLAYFLILDGNERYIAYVSANAQSIPREELGLWRWMLQMEEGSNLRTSVVDKLAEAYSAAGTPWPLEELAPTNGTAGFEQDSEQ